MAELHVEKKQKSNTMWVVIGVLVLALIAWLALRPSDDDVRNRSTVNGTTTGALSVVDDAVLASLAPSDAHNLINVG